ncbi:uncharacterized protein LOC123706747 [Pieris brassicae]|uniref:uncharacterized protein LOC123706747 n=1 Tax=Pieris brassicae TaxID=7116 RepID=UPI001E661906|nr:uncharacterized protein LOC123706747 [Pieris brassicae]
MYKHEHDPIWRQTALGCYVLDILKDMLQFKFGFLLRYKRTELKTFFTLPFSTLVWTCLIWTLFLSASVFYLLSYWEKRLLGGERCLQQRTLYFKSYWINLDEIFFSVLPLQANLSSRRIAYVIFILSAYVIHCFYTSTLLSHLVNDKDKGLNLEDLANTDYEFVIIKDMNLITEKHIQKVSRDKYLRIVEEKIYKSKVMDVYSALEAVRDTKTAVLTDYVTLYPVIKRLFDNQAQCELIEVNLYSKVKKYMFTSKTFPLTEQFKVVTLRLKEAGLLTRFLQCDRLTISCNDIIKL